jgi:glycopeptide antibiotics resistance protein
MPLGLTMPYSVICFYNKKVVRCVLLSMGVLAIGIEVLQFVLNLGRAETDDVISNLCGAFLGILSFWVYKRITGRHEK